MSVKPGILYVVATPIGNLGDISARAQQILAQVDFIAAEDTRRTRPLLQHLDISKPMVALHEHNERERIDTILARLEDGESMALVSDAGTPLISDPGYHLVRQAHARGIRVSPVPGASALLAALSISGLPTDHFRFEGFLPARRSARQQRLHELCAEPMTLVFYESSHRIGETIDDLCEIFGDQREAILARELTKLYETVLGYTLAAIRAALLADPNQTRGEFVLITRGADKAASVQDDVANAERLLRLLLPEMSLKSVSRVVASYTGLSKNELYQRALQLKQQDKPET